MIAFSYPPALLFLVICNQCIFVPAITALLCCEAKRRITKKVKIVV